MTRLLAFEGSGRTDSLNRMLLKNVMAVATEAGAHVTYIDLHALNLPIYNGDIEAKGLPEAVQTLKKTMADHDGFLIASPEYNGSYSALLKNTLDWVSRKQGDEKPMMAFAGKKAGIMSAAPGKLSGMRGLRQLNSLLFDLGVTVIPAMVSVGMAGQAFDASGNLTDEAAMGSAKRLVAALVG